MPPSKEIEKELSKVRGVGPSTLRRLEESGIRTVSKFLRSDAFTLSRRTGISIFKLVHIQATLSLSESLSLLPELSNAFIKEGLYTPEDLFSRSFDEIETLLKSHRLEPLRRKDLLTLKKQGQDLERRRMLIIISSKGGLVELFGDKGLSRIEKTVRRLSSRLSSRGVEAISVYLDTDSISAFGMKPLKKITPRAVKKAVDSIDSKLSAKEPGKRYFLVVGGHNVIPFYSLPNPAFDSDKEVLSDNPYGSSSSGQDEEGWLVPERPLGRLPTGGDNDAALLLSQLEAVEDASLVQPNDEEAMGYSARVWEEASREVFSKVEKGADLFLSPPLNTRRFMSEWLKDADLNYFNLHGSKEEKFWFGQSGSEFPRALSPEIVAMSNVKRSLVVTEACYGGYEVGKESKDSICLQFMQGMAACFLGSTTISYGSEGPPLGEADLLSSKFLGHVREGAFFGDALIRAKAEMTSELLLTQGYLDEDDRKTLLQFVLYGSPLGSIKF